MPWYGNGWLAENFGEYERVLVPIQPYYDDISEDELDIDCDLESADEAWSTEYPETASSDSEATVTPIFSPAPIIEVLSSAHATPTPDEGTPFIYLTCVSPCPTCRQSAPSSPGYNPLPVEDIQVNWEDYDSGIDIPFLLTPPNSPTTIERLLDWLEALDNDVAFQ